MERDVGGLCSPGCPWGIRCVAGWNTTTRVIRDPTAFLARAAPICSAYVYCFHMTKASWSSYTKIPFFFMGEGIYSYKREDVILTKGENESNCFRNMKIRLVFARNCAYSAYWQYPKIALRSIKVAVFILNRNDPARFRGKNIWISITAQLFLNEKMHIKPKMLGCLWV